MAKAPKRTPFPPPPRPFDNGMEYDLFRQQDKEASWIEHHGARFQPFPEVFAMSWRWPRWWGVPEVYDKETGCHAPYPRMPTDSSKWAEIIETRHTFIKNGLPVRLLKFWSGTQVWQLLIPVHGFDKPGATLPDPRDTHKFPW